MTIQRAGGEKIMREIKFRAWDDGKMYNVRAIVWHGGYVSNIEVFTEQGAEYLYSINAKLMQFTGLKDKHGNEIYEGDICKYSYINPMTREERTFVCKVEWSNGAYWLRSINDSSQDTLLWIQHKEIEVIGN